LVWAFIFTKPTQPIRNTMNNRLTIATLILFLILPLSTRAETRAQGGTGFKINQVRTFEADEHTVYQLDGEIMSQTRAQGGTGYKVRYKANATNPNLSQGTLNEIELLTLFKGPVLADSPARIFNISTQVNNQTHVVNDTPLQVGSLAVVSGFIDNESAAIATRIEVVENLTEWKMMGYIQQLTPTRFQIHDQSITYDPADVINCQGPLTNGQHVELKATPILGFQLGDELTSVLSVECVDERVIPKSPNGAVIIEGMIDGVTQEGDFHLSGQAVVVSAQTRYIKGRPEDIQNQIKIEVEGQADSVTGVVEATKIRFLEPRFNITLPVEPAAVSTDQIHAAGMTFLLTEQTQDPDNLLSNGLAETIQLQLKGYDQGNGELYVTRVYQRGQVDYQAIEVSGLVTDINAPVFHLFGLGFDTSGADFYDMSGQALTQQAFFAQLVLGAELTVTDASLDVQTGLISGGRIDVLELEPAESRGNGSGVIHVLGVGTLSSVSDPIFSAGFE